MDERIHEKLLKDTSALRDLVARCSTESIVGMVSALFLTWPEKPIDLTAPHKQLFFLLGLMLSTPEPSNPVEFDEVRLAQAKTLLESICSCYGLMYWPTRQEAQQLTPEWHKSREVAMPAFLHYFTSGLMASTEQVIDRIKRYVVPFDLTIKESLGITASEMLRITDTLRVAVQGDLDKMSEARRKEEETRHQFFEIADRVHWDDDKIREQTQETDHREAFVEFFALLQGLMKIERSELEKLVGKESADRYWDIFVANRGEGAQLTYFTEANPAERKPIFLIEETQAYIPSVHSVYLAILDNMERFLASGSQRETFFKYRDRTLERETEECVRKFFGDQAVILASVFETADSQFEHDIIVIHGRRVFIFEAKASPPVEPFRDAERAAVRIQRAFASDRGIQKAYDQAHRIESAIRSGRDVTLYDAEGHQVGELLSASIKEVYCICVTRDNFGLLASDLSLLLEKDTGDPYPFAANILDLQGLFDAWDYFGWGEDRFCEYLDGRRRMHGRVMADDELEFAGYMIEHGSFEQLFDDNYDRVSLNPSYSEVFTKVFLARHGGDPVEYKPHPAVTTNLSAEIEKWRTESYKSTTVPTKNPATRKQGRNERCACGSGKKYKRCCGA